MMADFRLDAAAETVHWGFFDAALKPLLSVDSGDTVTISTVSGMASQMPPPPYVIPKALPAIHAGVQQKLPGHMCTGPVAVKGWQFVTLMSDNYFLSTAANAAVKAMHEK